MTVWFVVNCKKIYFIYEAPDLRPALHQATLCGCAVFKLPTSPLVEAPGESAVKVGLFRHELNTEVFVSGSREAGFCLLSLT